MCGLFGSYCSQTLSKGEVERTIELGVISSLRGIDSTGVVVGRRKKQALNYNIHREVSNPVSFFSQHKNERAVMDNNPVLIMGHARAATYGLVNTHNAHPIWENSIIGAHNGTMWYYAPDKGKEDKESDSRLLFRTIHTDGLTTALSKSRSGAYALSFIDTKKQTLNFIRNDERPLHFVKDKIGSTLYWASERRFLYTMMLGHGGIDAYQEPFTLEKDHLYWIKTGDHVNSGKITSLVDSIDKLVKTRVYSYPYTGQEYQSKTEKAGYPRLFCKKCCFNIKLCTCPKGGSGLYFQPFEWQISDDGSKYFPEVKPVSVPLLPPGSLTKYLGFNRYEWTLAEVKGKLNKGCCGCGCVCSVDIPVFWIDDDYYVCEDCRVDPKLGLGEVQLFQGELVKEHQVH